MAQRRVFRPRGPTLEFGQRVRARRLELGLSQEALADRVDLHRTYVGSLERGERNVSLLNIVRLASALEIDAGQLLTGITP
jgi:transcriptional regulator with XRE-family HTH domain